MSLLYIGLLWHLHMDDFSVIIFIHSNEPVMKLGIPIVLGFTSLKN